MNPAVVAVGLLPVCGTVGGTCGCPGVPWQQGAEYSAGFRIPLDASIKSYVYRRYEIGYSSSPNPKVGVGRTQTDVHKSYVITSKNIR